MILRIAAPRAKSHLPLRIGRVLRLSLLLPCLLVRAVSAVVTASGGTHHAVTDMVASDATDDGAFNATLGVGCGRRDKQERGYREYDEEPHNGYLRGTR